MPDEPREIFPFLMHDKMPDNKLDFRPKSIAEPEEQVPDPKDSSVPEPANSSDSPLTIEPNPEQIASAEKVSTSPKANANGKQVSSDQISIG